MNPHTTSVIVDDRERPSGIIEILSEMENVNVSVERLNVGDYVINQRLVVERKRLDDFAVSIIDGRLFSQMKRLTSSNYKPILILEGNRQSAEALHVSREAIQGALITVSLIYGVPILRSQNIEETARLMLYSARQIESIATGLCVRKKRFFKRKNKQQLHILQGLPGIGLKRASELLEKFGTVEKVIQATQKELMEVHGIGKEIAQKIRWAVEESKAEYVVSNDMFEF